MGSEMCIRDSAVVLVADCSCSRYSSVNDQKEQIARLGKTVLGCVVYE